MWRCSSLAVKTHLSSSPEVPPSQHPQECPATKNNSAEMRRQSKVRMFRKYLLLMITKYNQKITSSNVPWQLRG